MRKFYLKQLLTALLLLCSAIASAHDFGVGGIYYNITDAVNKTVAVTYRGSSYNEYSNEYTGDVVIPESIVSDGETYRVTSIGEYAFYDCNGLTSIEIPNSVTNIGQEAFYLCCVLKSVVIPNSVTSIGDWAFEGCSGLKSIVIPNSVTSIGICAFYYCYGLTSIEIPNSVTSIGDLAFYNCSGLTSIVVKEGNTVYDSRNNCNAVIETATNTLVTGCKNTIIPDGITSIGDGAFAYCDGLTSIEIPNSVTSIGNDAFRDCSGLTSIVIPNSVTSIGDDAFYACSGLTSIVIPNSVTSIGNYAFNSCSGLTSVTSLIPAEYLFAINSDVFYNVDKNACTLYVPAGAKETYAATKGWSEFTNIKEIIEEPFALTVSAARYATLYLDYDAVIPAGVRVYYAEKIEGETLMMERINDVIPANTAVIVTGAAGTYTFDKAFEEVAVIENNLFQGSVEDTYITPEKGTKYYVLSIVDGVVGMYLDELAGGTFKNNAHKAYLPLDGESLGIFDTTVNSPSAQLSNRYTFNFSGTTAVESITTTASDEAIYDLNGVRVENPTKGIYIVNGKKVVY